MGVFSLQGEPGPVGPQGVAGEPGVGLPGPKVINRWAQTMMKKFGKY